MAKYKIEFLATACWLFIAASPALAQTSEATNEETASGGVEDIIVTAQRRSERLQDVPIAISAVTADALSQSGVTNADTLNQAVPGLQFGRQIGGATPYLRGVGSQNSAAGNESSIASYVDGVYRVSLFSSIQSFNNIERVEVLKGPQGTLFGRNATGGLINIITKDPSSDTSVTASGSYGNFDTLTGGFYGTTGMSDTLAADLAVTYMRQADGFGTNIATGNDVNASREFSIRSKLLWQPDDATRVVLSGDYSTLRSSQTIARQQLPDTLGFDGALIFGGCLAGGGTQAACAAAAAAGAARNTGNFYDINNDTDPYFTVKSYGGSLQIDRDIGATTLVSATSYRRSVGFQAVDQDATAQPIIFASLRTPTNDFQQELRLESNGGGPFKWIVGAYYLKTKTAYENFDLSGIGIGGLAPGGIAYRALPVQRTTSLAGFVQASYTLAEKTTLTAGIRYTSDKRSFSATNFVSFGAPTGPFPNTQAEFDALTYIQVPVTATGALVGQSSKTFTDPSWRLSFDHKINPDLLVYASYNRGFKSGVYNLANASVPGPVRPEKIDAYEVGVKSQLADNLIRLNGSAFYYNYKDLQLQSIALGSVILLNAANARIKGADLELEFVPSSRATLRAALSYLDAKYLDFPSAPFFFQTGIGGNASTIGDAAGKLLARSPKLTFNIGGNVNFDTPAGLLEIYGNSYYNDGFYFDPQNIVRQGQYVLVNMGASLKINERIKFRASVDNLFDKQYTNYADNGSFGGTISAASPRLYRAGFEVTF